MTKVTGGKFLKCSFGYTRDMNDRLSKPIDWHHAA